MAICTNSTVFFGWTQEELEALLTQIKASVSAEGVDYVTSASVAGKSVANGQRMSLRDWMRELKKALREVDPTTYGVTRTGYRSVVDGRLEK